jgi:hypothetical protein
MVSREKAEPLRVFHHSDNPAIPVSKTLLPMSSLGTLISKFFVNSMAFSLNDHA